MFGNLFKRNNTAPEQKNGHEVKPLGSKAPLIHIEDMTKVYQMGEVEVHALRGLSLNINTGEVVSIMGPSGSGKSTLMNMLGCLDRPTTGEYYLDGENVANMNDNQLADIGRTGPRGRTRIAASRIPVWALALSQWSRVPRAASGRLVRPSGGFSGILAAGGLTGAIQANNLIN